MKYCIMLVGLPASGKSTFLKTFDADYEVFSAETLIRKNKGN